jgi:hypothetical protein
MNTAPTVTNADAILAHKFPEQGNSDTYTIQLPAGVIGGRPDGWGRSAASWH